MYTYIYIYNILCIYIYTHIHRHGLPGGPDQKIADPTFRTNNNKSNK